MNKTVERLITVGAIVAVAVFFYQVAYGAASDVAKKAYDFGFGLGKVDVIHKYFSMNDALKLQHE